MPSASWVQVGNIKGPSGADGVAGQDGTDGLDGVDGAQGASGGSFVRPVNSPATLVQIVHGLAYQPAGILCIDSLGRTVEYESVTNPMSGVTEITFGGSFGPGVIYLS